MAASRPTTPIVGCSLKRERGCGGKGRGVVNIIVPLHAVPMPSSQGVPLARTAPSTQRPVRHVVGAWHSVVRHVTSAQKLVPMHSPLLLSASEGSANAGVSVARGCQDIQASPGIDTKGGGNDGNRARESSHHLSCSVAALPSSQTVPIAFKGLVQTPAMQLPTR